jgi:ATP adenylyltransferase
MNRLWAPWRSKYIYLREVKDCIFCTHPKYKEDARHYVLSRGKFSFSMLNIYPYNNGHIMIAPYRHEGSIVKLAQRELDEIMMSTKKWVKVLDELLGPDGYNIGMNIGKVSGAGYADHLHFHIVPRWNGDTNFMPVISDTKVVSESLAEIYKRLRQGYTHDG